MFNELLNKVGITVSSDIALPGILVASFYDDDSNTLKYLGDDINQAQTALRQLQSDGDVGAHVLARR